MSTNVNDVKCRHKFVCSWVCVCVDACVRAYVHIFVICFIDRPYIILTHSQNICRSRVVRIHVIIHGCQWERNYDLFNLIFKFIDVDAFTVVESYISMLGFVHFGLVRVLDSQDTRWSLVVRVDLVYVLVRHAEEMTWRLAMVHMSNHG